MRTHINKYHRWDRDAGLVSNTTGQNKEGKRVVRQARPKADQDEMEDDSESFLCEFCSECLPSSRKLNQHMAKHHADQLEDGGNYDSMITEDNDDGGGADADTEQRLPDDRLECPICHAEHFATVKAYEEHLRDHYKGREVSARLSRVYCSETGI